VEGRGILALEWGRWIGVEEGWVGWEKRKRVIEAWSSELYKTRRWRG
jgi:hypothetical protein